MISLIVYSFGFGFWIPGKFYPHVHILSYSTFSLVFYIITYTLLTLNSVSASYIQPSGASQYNSKYISVLILISLTYQRNMNENKQNKKPYYLLWFEKSLTLLFWVLTYIICQRVAIITIGRCSNLHYMSEGCHHYYRQVLQLTLYARGLPSLLYAGAPTAMSGTPSKLTSNTATDVPKRLCVWNIILV